MMREPWFWRDTGIAARIISLALTPAAALYNFGQQARSRLSRPRRAPVPVICIGNATVGGVGKTPFAIALAELLTDRGRRPHFLTRGYGGTEKGPLQVDPSVHSFHQVGDEALLLMETAPTWVAAERYAGACAAAKAGADIVIMDDGFQNPTIHKDFSILLTRNQDAFGNGRVFPAGPLREPPARARERADLEVVIDGPEGSADRPIARLAPTEPPKPARVVAFCGIGNPRQFFDMLIDTGHDMAAEAAFPDHHAYTLHELEALTRQAETLDAQLITTEKDAVRLPDEMRKNILILKVKMNIFPFKDLLNAIEALIDNESPLK
ncbi:MAG: tetraacyldisaccharide 4'-kinase [Pseudomonadota bacterium]